MTFDERLIEFIRGKEYLYDRTNENYRNNDLKDLEWHKIAIELDSTERCKKRWGSLRDRYKRIKKHHLVSGFSKKWKYFDSLSFISGDMDLNSAINGFEGDETILELEEVQTNSPQDTKSKNNELTAYFSSFVDEAKNAVSKLPATENTTPPDTTDEFFHYLAKRVKAANLNSMQEMRIEAAILNFTVEKLNEIKNEM